MVHLSLDENTYNSLKRRASERGMTVEQWLKHISRNSNGSSQMQTLSTQDGDQVDDSHAASHDDRPPEELTIEERLARLDKLHDLAGNYGGQVDYSRDAIYK